MKEMRMRLVMAGLDHENASMATREAFAIAAAALPACLAAVRRSAGVDGAAILCTCNRTELYVTYADGAETEPEVAPDAAGLLCSALGLAPGANRQHLIERHGNEAVLHLFRVAAGIKSSVLADDQILTQVRAAIEAAREHDASDAILETLFRFAVTAGKRVKTSVLFARAGSSVAERAVRAIEEKLGGLAGKRVLVIGNGSTGRLAAEHLLAAGASVTVTLRNSRAAPPGCAGGGYDERYRLLAESAAVVSATTNPGFTVQSAELALLPYFPKVFADLAVPRDIDPAVARLPGVTLWNVDHFRSPGDADENAAARAAAGEIIAEEAERFSLWRRGRTRRARVDADIPDFPAFINLHGATVLMAGAGKVAARRTGVLLGFGARVRVVAPELSPEMEKLADRGGVTLFRRGYEPTDLAGVTLAVAATSDRAVNRQIGLDARARGVLVSVADRRDECTFYFPAVVQSENFTAGLISRHGEHSLVKRAAAAVRRELENFDEDNSRGEQGQRAGGDAGALRHGGGRRPAS